MLELVSPNGLHTFRCTPAQGRGQESQKFCDRGADPYFWSKFSNSWVKKRFLPRQGGMPPLPPLCPPPGYAPEPEHRINVCLFDVLPIQSRAALMHVT